MLASNDRTVLYQNYCLGISSIGFVSFRFVNHCLKDSFIEWESLLSECMSTLEFSESFVQATIANGEEQVNQALEFFRTAKR